MFIVIQTPQNGALNIYGLNIVGSLESKKKKKKNIYVLNFEFFK
jgi:hypothetical protein